MNEVTTSVAIDFFHNAPYSRVTFTLLNGDSDRQTVIAVVLVSPRPNFATLKCLSDSQFSDLLRSLYTQSLRRYYGLGVDNRFVLCVSCQLGLGWT